MFNEAQSCGCYNDWLNDKTLNYCLLGYNINKSYPIYLLGNDLYIPSNIDSFIYRLKGCRING